ncbi:MAG TPA: molybdopterin molybdotransferase MoeA [Chryseosolibacter sp.]
MISVSEATQAILAHLHSPAVARVPIEKAIRNILAETIKADRDFPPFDRVTMDGIAIAFDQYQAGAREFAIEKIHAAGEPQVALDNPSNAIEVMTGAMLPEGTDTVIRYEDVIINDKRIASLRDIMITKGQSIHSKGQDARKDETLLEPGLKLSAAEIALLASVGKTQVAIVQGPKTAIIGSGDELVSVNDIPMIHQIRRSNTYALQAAMHDLNWAAGQYHLADNKEQLSMALKKLLDEHDVLILSGGVSKGKFDFIPAVLEELGVKKVFHEVSQRPGKPFWFGVKGSKRIFALPGNPVSTFMCFYRYIRPWFFRSLGVETKPEHAVLAKDFSFQPKLTYFLQVQVRNENGCLRAYPDQGGGSGDFANLKKIDGFLELPSEKTDFKAGDVFPFIPFRG